MRKKKKSEITIGHKIKKQVLQIRYKNNVVEEYELGDAPQFDSKTMLEQKIVRYFE
jgi:hypothetical protein